MSSFSHSKSSDDFSSAASAAAVSVFSLHRFGVASDELRVEKFHVTIDAAFEEIVMVIVLVESLDAEQMIAVLLVLLLAVHSGDTKLAGIKVDLILQQEIWS